MCSQRKGTREWSFSPSSQGSEQVLQSANEIGTEDAVNSVKSISALGDCPMAKALILLKLVGQSMGPNEGGMNSSYIVETDTSKQYFLGTSLSDKITGVLDLLQTSGTHMQGSSKDGRTLAGGCQWSD